MVEVFTERGEELVRSWEATEPWATALIVHGLGEHSGRYERVASLLAERGISVRSFDLFGFGASAGARADIESWDEYLEQIERHLAVLRARSLPIVLIGHSMGGLLALEYAVSDRMAPNAVVASAPALSGGRGWQRAIAPVVGKLLPGLPTPNAIKGDQLSRDPTVGEAYFSDPLVQTKTSARLGANLFAAMDRCRAALGHLSIPTLVLHGGADTVVPPQASAPLADHEAVDRTLYPRLRHEIFNEPEGPEVVGDAIAWLSERFRS